ncbi:MAG: fatty acid desaturase [Myxococcales bacterium]|nr:fatty acid desaturase [Myxococcales bacterium]
MSTTASRDGKALIEASKDFTGESLAKSWAHLIVVMLVIAATTTVAAVAPYWPVRLLAAIVSGLSIVRMFIVYHDFMHGALLRGSRVAKWILGLYGMLVLAPPRVWKETHNYHHAHTAQIIGSHIGSFPVVTTEMWKKMSGRDRLKYRVVRHPITILLGYVPIFMIGMCVNSLRKSVTKYWDSAAALILNWVITFVLVWQFGFATAFFTFLLPLMVATAAGGYLFYAQHNFPSMMLQPRQEWTFTKAALESSSYMEMGPVMRWFTGNIGYHHVHHLNSQIPFYRLPETMAAMSELQHPGTTSLKPWDIWQCLTLKLWDPQKRQMVGYP